MSVDVTSKEADVSETRAPDNCKLPVRLSPLSGSMYLVSHGWVCQGIKYSNIVSDIQIYFKTSWG